MTTIQGYFVDCKGAAVAQKRITIVGQSSVFTGQAVVLTTDASGYIETTLQPGTYNLVIQGAERLTFTAPDDNATHALATLIQD